MRNIKNINIIKIDKKKIINMLKKNFKKTIKQAIIHVIKFFYFLLIQNF